MFCIMLLVLNISKICSQPENHAMLKSSTVTYRQLAVASLAAVHDTMLYAPAYASCHICLHTSVVDLD